MLTTKRASARAARVEVFEGELHVGTIIKQGPTSFWWVTRYTGDYADTEFLAMKAIEKELE